MSKDQTRGGYKEVAVLDDAGGARAIITQKQGTATFTVAFMRTFNFDGSEEKTHFFGEKHLDSLERIVPVARAKIKELADAATAGSVDRRR